jgi:hypothetical protein
MSALHNLMVLQVPEPKVGKGLVDRQVGTLDFSGCEHR